MLKNAILTKSRLLKKNGISCLHPDLNKNDSGVMQGLIGGVHLA
jgi:hypothetical protein